MFFQLKPAAVFFRYLIIIAAMIIVSTNISFSQTKFKGRIIGGKDEKPVAFATIGVKGKNSGGISDSSGYFEVSLPSFIKKSDTVIISSIGYVAIRTPLGKALGQAEFMLLEAPVNLPGVILTNFVNESAIDNSNQTRTYYRGWYDYKTGGEIGKIVYMPVSEYKIQRIRFRVDNQCDTCWVRLHIRKVTDGSPGEELLPENVIVPITKFSADDNGPEFDLKKQNLILSDSPVFISFEILNCHSATVHSLCFIGSDDGNYYYKQYANSFWEKESQYGLYMRVDIQY